MSLTPVREVPADAVHEPDQDVKLPNGTSVEQFRLRQDSGADRVFERFTSEAGSVRVYVLSPESATGNLS